MSARRMANDTIYGTSNAQTTKGVERNLHNKVEDNMRRQEMGLAPSLLQALHSHIRSSLFDSVCADIRVRAFGRIYSLHRIFLVQSPFFDSLLNGEFSEAKTRLGVWRSNKKRKESGIKTYVDTQADDLVCDEDEEVMELHFDDPNFTRPAFEYCIATLYGSAPTLILPEWASPSPSFPLTRQFEPNKIQELANVNGMTSQTDSDGSVDEQGEEQIQPNSLARHPATPRFLLSLLATSSYLEIPSIVSQALTLILCSITPFTVSHYLRFALGYGITGALEAKQRSQTVAKEWDWELEGPAWGLSNLGKEDKREERNEHSTALSDTMAQMALSNDPNEDTHLKGSGDVTYESKFDSSLFGFYYGIESDKIGEACSCWLLRWGADTLIAEEKLHMQDKSEGLDYMNPVQILPFGSMPECFYETSSGKSNKIRCAVATPQPIIWRHPLLGGLPANWVRMIISSDSFWIREEWDRYEAAKRVVSMRRSFARIDYSNHTEEGGNEGDSLEEDSKMKETGDLDISDSNIGVFKKDEKETGYSNDDDLSHDLNRQHILDADDEADENEYNLLFAEGIYYTHLSFNRLSSISSDICPHIGQPYAPMNVLQGALWTQSELRNIVLSKVPDSDKQVAIDSRTRDDEDEEDNRVARENNASPRDVKETDTERELGLVSEEAEFVKVCSSLGKRGRSSRAHLGDDGKPIVLGGVTPLMQPMTLLPPPSNLSALDSLLGKRFFAVPGDDTVRIGENLSSLTSIQNQSNNLSERKAQTTFGLDPHNLDRPTGIASASDSNVLSIGNESKFRTSGNFFGFCNAVRQGKELGKKGSNTSSAIHKANEDIDASSGASVEWTGFEPMRIGVEFYDVDRLTEKQRSYSPSFFYAGSVWNLYIQTVRKPKGLQLGIYLHRQNCSDTLPTPSRPSRMQTALRANVRQSGEASMLQLLNNEESINRSSIVRLPSPSRGSPTTQSGRRATFSASTSNLVTDDVSPEQLGYQNTLTSSIQSPSRTQAEGNHLQSSGQQGTSLHATQNGAYSITPSLSGFGEDMSRLLDHHVNTDSVTSAVQEPEIPYSDQRRILRAYFSIHCPSPMGSSLTKFSSRPDNFTLSQSWGWKSSSLLGAVYLEDGKLGSARSQTSQTFRCIVTMGVV